MVRFGWSPPSPALSGVGRPFEGRRWDQEYTMLRSRLLRPLLVLFVIGQASLVLVRAQSPRPMGIVDLLNIPRLADPQLSPDGREVVYTRADADWKSGRRISHVWRA